MAKPKIFVSHSTPDTAFAKKLVNDLNAAGAQAWLDSNDSGVGDFQERINEALADCEWFVLVLTTNAIKSTWVHQEVNAANRLQHLGQIRDLIVIKAESLGFSAFIPPLWGVFNILDATSDSNYTSAMNRTLKALGLTSSATAPMPQHPVRKRGGRPKNHEPLLPLLIKPPTKDKH